MNFVGVVFLIYLVLRINWVSWIFGFLVFIKGLKWPLFKCFFCLSNISFRYIYVRLIESIPQPTDVFIYFLNSYFYLWFILDSFYYFIFKFTYLPFCKMLSACNSIQCIFLISDIFVLITRSLIHFLKYLLCFYITFEHMEYSSNNHFYILVC